MAENKRGQVGGDNRSGQDRNQGHQGPNDRNRGFFNNPSGETRGVNPSDQNKKQPTAENLSDRNQDLSKRSQTEIPQRKEERETKIPKAQQQSERDKNVYGDVDGDAGSQ